MSDPKYKAGITRGIAGSIFGGSWPEAVPVLGHIQGGKPFGRCEDCKPSVHLWASGTFVCYGGRRLCKMHANQRAIPEPGESQEAS